MNIAVIEIAAESLDECLALLRSVTPSDKLAPPSEVAAAARIAAWEEALASDSSGYLAQRVRSAGFDVRNITALLPYLPAGTLGGGWGQDFAAIVESLSSGLPTCPYPFPDAAYAFGNALWPLCHAASSTLLRTSSVPKCALIAFQGWLLSRLVETAGPALYAQLCVFRDAEPRNGQAGTYDRFCRRLQAEALANFLYDRPALARMITVIMKQSVQAFEEFLGRLDDDVAKLSKLSKTPHLVLESVEPGLSDSHNGGRTVFRVGFSKGVGIYYKPRSLAPEQFWLTLLGWMEAAGGPKQSGYPATVDRGQYGWQVECRPAQSASPGTFFRTLGAQLALFRALGSSDMHHENVIARGISPVFVDLEMLFSPTPRFSMFPNDALRAAESELVGSVWRSGVLPDATLLPSGEVMTFGALAEAPSTSGVIWGFSQCLTRN